MLENKISMYVIIVFILCLLISLNYMMHAKYMFSIFFLQLGTINMVICILLENIKRNQK